MKPFASIALGSLILSGCASLAPPAPIAVADLKPTQGNTAGGTASFVQRGNKLMVDARVKGLAPGLHGFHVHETGDCSAPDASSAGGHFNPAGAPHGDPAGGPHHGGDLGNLNADASGEAVMINAIPVQDMSLEKGGKNSIAGRALVVHADPDDLKSQPAGNSGKRIACGVIQPQ
jgi:Cu-Zn family superoxide dismutase